MFDLLKKKFSSFIGSITKKENEENKVEEQAAQQEEEQVQQDEPRRQEHVFVEKEVEVQKRQGAKVVEKPKTETVQHAEASKKTVGSLEAQRDHKPAREAEQPTNEQHHKISLETKIKGFIFGTVEIKERDVQDILEDFKLALLESDVNYAVAEKIVDTMHKRLVGSKVDSRNIEQGIRSIIRDSISEILSKNSGINIVDMARAKRSAGSEPFTILFIGPNGAGKTTTMGKIASMMLKNNLTCVLSASDTFRAAAIEQTAIHAQRLGINVVKGAYGVDPASIAFDAVAYAKARGIDIVLIDSAGRQDTNRNLVEEMKKMVRVAKPDMKIFVGESIAGNALVEQIKTFDEAIKLDGVILTKLDVDAKGGNTISVLSETTIPVLFFGIGEAYDSLIPYDQKLILDNIVPI